MEKFKTYFLNLANHCVEKLQMCNYFENFIYVVELLKDLVAVSRDGDCEAHLVAVQNILPIFRGSDSISYLRYLFTSRNTQKIYASSFCVKT